MLKKIPNILKMFKKKIQAGDGEEVKGELQELKDEIKAKKVLDAFGNASRLQKIIFGAIASLMLMACNSNANNADNNQELQKSFNNKNAATYSIDDAFSKMDNEVQAACDNSEHCSVTTFDQKVIGGDGDGENTFTWKLAKEQSAKNGGHFFKIAIDQDNNGKTDMGVIIHTASDGHIEHIKWLNGDKGNEGTWEKANDKVVKIFPNINKMISSY
jgi:uncharacterized lipoprotein YajG